MTLSDDPSQLIQASEVDALCECTCYAMPCPSCCSEIVNIYKITTAMRMTHNPLAAGTYALYNLPRACRRRGEGIQKPAAVKDDHPWEKTQCQGKMHECRCSTVLLKNSRTCVYSIKKTRNLSRSLFKRSWQGEWAIFSLLNLFQSHERTDDEFTCASRYFIFLSGRCFSFQGKSFRKCTTKAKSLH